MEKILELIDRMILALISATRAVPGGVKEFDRLIDEAIEFVDKIRLTPVAPDRAEARDGDDESPTCAAGEPDG